jgi:hypothetical protein
MNTGKHDVAARSDRPADSKEPGARLRQLWSITATLLVAAIFIEAIFAGAMLSGANWARAAHAMNATILIVSTTAAGLVALVTLRHVSHGLKFGLTLLSLAAVVFLQIAVGKLSAEGANLLWVHVPLGVALVGFAAQAAAGARRLGGE